MGRRRVHDSSQGSRRREHGDYSTSACVLNKVCRMAIFFIFFFCVPSVRFLSSARRFLIRLPHQLSSKHRKDRKGVEKFEKASCQSASFHPHTAPTTSVKETRHQEGSEGWRRKMRRRP